ncbi:MAG: DUF6883 domain-containing protein [Candidatus Methylomirabilales bacterium]
MKVPNADDARVNREKLNAYLLFETPPVGRSKAKFFRSVGFDESNMAVLEQALIALVKNHDVLETAPSPYGMTYVVEGSIRAPSGNLTTLRTVWIVEKGQTFPRFVTAYPM